MTIDGKYYPPFSSVADLLQDYNCLHYKFPILLGISEPTYGESELASMKEHDRRTFEYEGKQYTGYEASQMQRKLETEIRKQKDRANLFAASGDDDGRRAAQEKINLLTKKYKEFSDAAGLPYKTERMSVAKFHRVKTAAELKRNQLTNAAHSAIPKNTGATVKYNPNASFKVSVPKWSKQVNEGISNACAEVAKLGGNDNCEHLCLVDLKNGETVYTEQGDSDSVGGITFWKFIKANSEKSFAFVHNHNTDGFFSETDMQTLLKNQGIDAFVVARRDGVIYVVESNEKIDSSTSFDKLFENELKELNYLSKSGKIDSGERTYMRETIIVNKAIERYTKGLIEFDTR